MSKAIETVSRCVQFFGLLTILCSCSGTGNSDNTGTNSGNPAPSADGGSAQVISVSVSGEPNDYRFSVTLQSPDTGCDQYADWWEVITADGRLVYRRILAHSHVSEQPFSRSGGPVDIVANEEVIVRAHMNNSGYGSQVFTGTVQAGLATMTTESVFAENLAFVDPLPTNCAF